jgi:hypothetical protein
MPQPNIDILDECAPWCAVESTDPAIEQAETFRWFSQEIVPVIKSASFRKLWQQKHEQRGCFMGYAGASNA